MNTTKREELLADILDLVKKDPGIRPSEINKRLGLEQSNALRENLIRRGLIRKERDGAAVRLYPTSRYGSARWPNADLTIAMSLPNCSKTPTAGKSSGCRHTRHTLTYMARTAGARTPAPTVRSAARASETFWVIAAQLQLARSLLRLIGHSSCTGWKRTPSRS